MQKEHLGFFSKDKLAIIALVLVGSISWVATMFRSGLFYSYGLGFWGPHAHDGIWHIALAESLARGSFDMPTFAGSGLQNYHLGYDIILAFLYKITTISISTLYFQVLPLIFAILIGSLTYVVILKWKRSFDKAFWSVFFVYFAGSLGWIVTLLRGDGLGGESMFWSQQAISTLVNPPYALSIIFILLGVYLLLLNQEKRSIFKILLSGLVFGLLIQVKVYAGLLVLAGLFASGIYLFIRDKKKDVLLTFLVSFIVSLLLFFAVPISTRSAVSFYPFWFLETMMIFQDRLNWPRFYWAMETYKAGSNYIRAFVAYGTALFIFVIGNLGTRIISYKSIKKGGKKDGSYWLDVFFFTVIIFGFLVPIFFVQMGIAWNTIQFFYYSLFALSLYAGIAVGSLPSKKTNWVAIAIIVIITLPTTVSTLNDVYLTKLPPAVIVEEETKALEYLSKLPEGVVLTYPHDRTGNSSRGPTVPVYDYESTAYVSALSKKPVFLEDEVNLEIMNYPWEERKAAVLAFFSLEDSDDANTFLKDNNISYVYLINGQKIVIDPTYISLDEVFSNDLIKIYQVR